MNKLNAYAGVLIAATLAVVVWFVFFKKNSDGDSAVSEFLGKKK
jgi:hypothetical protein